MHTFSFEDAVKQFEQMYLLPLIPFGILIRPTQQSTLKKDLYTEAALNVWFYTLQISTDCYWLETLRLVIVTETEPFPHGIQLAIFNPLVVFTGVDLQMFGSRNPDVDVNTERSLSLGDNQASFSSPWLCYCMLQFAGFVRL